MVGVKNNLRVVVQYAERYCFDMPGFRASKTITGKRHCCYDVFQTEVESYVMAFLIIKTHNVY